LSAGELGKKNDLGGDEATFEGFAKGLQVSSTCKLASRLLEVVGERADKDIFGLSYTPASNG
jgi:hypothetical protein